MAASLRARPVDALHEGPVDLEVVGHREVAQVVERGVAGAEVVDGDAHAEPLEPFERRDGVVHVVDERALGHLEAEPGRIEAGQVEHVGHHLDQLGIGELARRQVDRHLDVPITGQRRPRHRVGHRLAEHPPPDRDDQPRLLGDRDEAVRHDHVVARTVPAHQRLDLGHGAVAQLHDRLVVQHELLALDGRGAGPARGPGARRPAGRGWVGTPPTGRGPGPWPGTWRRRRRG